MENVVFSYVVVEVDINTPKVVKHGFEVNNVIGIDAGYAVKSQAKTRCDGLNEVHKGKRLFTVEKILYHKATE